MMKLRSVYVYRYDGMEHTWSCKRLDRCLVSGTVNAYTLSDTQNRNASLTLRVMTRKDADVSPEDVIAFSESAGTKPPEKGCAVVVSVTDNRRGSSRVCHTKILCR